ncbi:TIGR03773 family transporter-associated surface protein [Curtobacterium flaccumfaciens]|uniref:TIGR03773 family transporter-associated surface protein n=1 Tax=Curtobacterium flaccumfaciens TaxID=2035 RepID=UPI00188B5483|nr:TIGR03773 family transporter-associated surface protein [Curtobacterium flaccumfaciens]MBF4595757.1 TIGR03773 family transporter-associated surface protein [Curtobacterium flaccumfaciens]
MRRTDDIRTTALFASGLVLSLAVVLAPTEAALASLADTPPATQTAAESAADADAPRFTDRDGVRVYDSGWLAMTPRFDRSADGKPTSAQLGLVDKTDPDITADSWRPAATTVVHIAAPSADGAYSLPAADADYLNGEQSVYGIDQSAAEYAKQGGTLFGFDTQSLEGQLNAGLAVSYNSSYSLEAATGAGWQVSRSDVNWDTSTPVRTISTVWTPADHEAKFGSTPGAYGRSAGWTFTTAGTYCFTVKEGLKTKEPKGTPSTDLSAQATYTVVVGDLPDTLTTCAQPTEAGGTTTNLITTGHHDLRTYIGSDGQIRWGMDSALVSLDNVVIGRTPPAVTVQQPRGATDMRVVGPVGTKYWYLPQTSTTGTGNYVWPGWSTESMDRPLMGSKVGISLDGFTRNGTVDPAAKVMLLATSSGRPADTHFDSSAGITSFEQSGNNHSHSMWVFTQPGMYCVAMTATLKTAAGHWTSATQNLGFAVGDDVNLTSVTPCGGVAVPSLSSTLSTPPSSAGPTRLEEGAANVALDIDGDTVRGIASTGLLQTDPKLVRDPEDLIVHGSRYDGGTERWRGVYSNGGGIAIRTDGIDPSAVLDRHITLGLGAVDGPGSVAAISSDGTKQYGAVSTELGGTRSMDVPVRSTTRNLQWYFSNPGIYCVPLTYSATLVNGQTVTGGDTLTFAVGPNKDGSGIDLSKYTTCSRGQHGVNLTRMGNDPDQGTDGNAGPRHEDVYVQNGATNRAGATVLNDGHVDVASRLRAGTLDTVVKDTTASSKPTWRDLRGTVLQLLPESKATVPTGYDFLGKAGSPVWQVEQTQQPDLLWPGWSTESLPEDATEGGVTWALNDVQGYPDDDGTATKVGNFALYEQIGFGDPDVLLSSKENRSTVISKNVHAHGTWAFSREGVYCMSMTRSAIAANGSDLQDDFVMAIAVGYVSVQNIDPKQCFSGKTPRGDAEGTTGGGTSTTDAREGTAAAPSAPSALSVPGTVCTAVPAKTASTATGTGASATANTTVISRGHVDVGSRIVNGKVRTLVKDGSQSGVVWREPGATTLWLKPASKVSSPGGKFSFLGADGEPAWQVPQTQNPDLIWLGWNTEELTAAQAAGPVQWRLDSVDGPGRVTVYELASFGAPKQILTAGATTSIPLGVHAHGNWGFTAEGTYRLHMTQTVPLTGGGTSSDQQTLTIVVGRSAPHASSGGTGTETVTTKDADACETAAFGSTVPAIMQAEEPETEADGGGTIAGGARPIAKAAPGEQAPAPQTGAWLLAAIGFGGVLGAGGTGSLATWLLTRRRGLEA